MSIDPEDLYRKLKPADPRAEDLWKIEKLLDDSRERQEWRNLIELHKQNLTGESIEEKILLDVPPEETCKGEYPLGIVWHGDTRMFHPFCLREAEMPMHISIFGLTGSGKTNTALQILQTVPHPFIVFDWKRSYRNLMTGDNVLVYTVGRKVAPLHFNPFVPPEGVDYEMWLKSVIWAMQHAFFLGHGAERILEKTLPGCRNLDELAMKLDLYKARARELDWLQSTKRAVDALCWGELGRQLNQDGVSIEGLLDRKVVFELDALTPSEAVFLTYIIVLGVYAYKQELGDRRPNIVIVEEAHNVLPEARDIKQETPLEKAMRMIRELGTCMIVIDQLPHKLSRAAIANTNTTICLNLKLAEDVESAGKALLLPGEKRKFLGQLRQGEAIIKSQHRHPQPFLTRIPLVRLDAVSDDEVSERMEAFLPQSVGKEWEIPPAARKLELGKRELRMLVDVNEHPFDGLQERYRRLDLDGKAGARLVRELENDGWVKSEFLSLGHKNYKVLSLTGKAKLVLEERGHEVERHRDGSVEHRYWQDQWLRKMKEKYPHCQVVKEYPIGRGETVDVAVLEGGEGKVAVEIETSSVDRALRNVKKDLEAGFEKVIVVGKKRIIEGVESENVEKIEI